MNRHSETTQTRTAIGTSPLPSSIPRQMQFDHANWPVAVLALMMLVVPAVGVPSELMLQDTLKSALVAIGVLIAALVFFWHQRHRTEPLLWHGMLWLPLALMVYALGSMVWSHTYLAGVEAIRWFILSLLLWLGLNTVTRENLPMLVWGIHGGVVVASVWAVLQFWLKFDLFPQFALPASTFANRNFFAENAVCALPFSIFVLASMRASRWLVLLALSVALDLVALMMTGTRSALLAMLVLTPVITLILIRYRQQFSFSSWGHSNQLLIIAVLIASVFGLGSLPSRNAKVIQEKLGTTALQRAFIRGTSMTETKEYTDGTFSVRSVMWKATARMVMAKPWTGVGAGAWEVQIPLYQGFDNALETDYYAHNEFLQLLGEYGVVVGGIFIAALFAYLLLATSKTWRLRGPDLAEAPLRAMILSSLLALLIVSNAGFPWRLAGTGAILALDLALLAASDARLGFRDRFFSVGLSWQPGFSHAMVVLSLCSTVLAAYITQQAVRAEFNLGHSIEIGNEALKLRLTDPAQLAMRKTELLQYAREGIAINPHYRKLSHIVAFDLALLGDWENSLWIWESLTASRPHIALVWSNIAATYMRLGQESRAFDALKQLQRLQPGTPRVRELEVTLLSRTGRAAQAEQMLNNYYDRGEYDYALVQAGYSIGRTTHRWPLAVRSLVLQNLHWPEHAADGYLKLGHIYASDEFHDDAQALAAFRAGLRLVPGTEQEQYRALIPERYRSRS